MDRIQVPCMERKGRRRVSQAREGRPSRVHSCVHSHVFSHAVRNSGRHCHVLRCGLYRRRHAVSAAGSPHRCAGARAHVTGACASNDVRACLHACCRPHPACMRTEAPRELAADQVGLSLSSWQQCSPNSSSTISSRCRSSASLHQRSKTSNIIRSFGSVCAWCSAERVVLRSIGHGNENGNPVRGGERNGALVLSGRRRT